MPLTAGRHYSSPYDTGLLFLNYIIGVIIPTSIGYSDVMSLTECEAAKCFLCIKDSNVPSLF